VLVTIVLMNNTEEINFWLFGATSVPKLVVLGIMFGLGFIIGIMAARPRKKEIVYQNQNLPESDTHPSAIPESPGLSDEDRDYIN